MGVVIVNWTTFLEFKATPCEIWFAREGFDIPLLDSLHHPAYYHTRTPILIQITPWCFGGILTQSSLSSNPNRFANGLVSFFWPSLNQKNNPKIQMKNSLIKKAGSRPAPRPLLRALALSASVAP